MRKRPYLAMALLISLGSALALAGCAAKPPKAAETKAMITASPDVNPDSTGRPSPVVVRIFQLRGDAEFSGADFFSLYEKEKETLGASLVLREEVVLRPGESQERVLPLSPEARFLGVIAAYRDIRGAQWRQLVAAPEKSLIDLLSRDRVTIQVDKSALTVAIKD